MVIKKMINLLKKIIILSILLTHTGTLHSYEPGFDEWLSNFKIVSKNSKKRKSHIIKLFQTSQNEKQ